MGKPYSDLEKRAIAILAGGGNPATSADKEVANYWQWKINPTASNHDLPATSTRTAGRKLEAVGINPFQFSLPVSVFARVTISERAKAFAASFKTELGHDDLTGTNLAYPLGKFRPAKVYARKGASETSSERISRITGRRYKSYYAGSDEGFTAPFGEKTIGDDQFERQLVIRSAILASDTTINLITFSPEKANL